MNKFIYMYEVKFAVKQARLNKAVGIDGLPNEAFKNDYQRISLQGYLTY